MTPNSTCLLCKRPMYQVEVDGTQVWVEPAPVMNGVWRLAEGKKGNLLAMKCNRKDALGRSGYREHDANKCFKGGGGRRA